MNLHSLNSGRSNSIIQLNLSSYSNTKNNEYEMKYFSSLPKVELHRHFSGCIREKTMFELFKQYNINTHLLKTNIQNNYIERSLPSFLHNWDVINQLTTQLSIKAPDKIGQLVYESCEDAFYLENIRYLELRMAPYGLTINNQFNPMIFNEIQSSIIQAIDLVQNTIPIVVKIIYSIPRHFLGKKEKWFRDKYYNLLIDNCLDYKEKYIAGFDLSGMEVNYPPKLYEDFFKRVKKNGYNITIHAAETVNPTDIIDAFELLGADRIGHGIQAIKNNRVIDFLQKVKIPLEICVTSNLITGAVKSLNTHPIIEFYKLGIPITINTDNPSAFLCNTNMNKEYEKILKLGLSLNDIKNINYKTIDYIFADKMIKEKLRRTFVEIYKESLVWEEK